MSEHERDHDRQRPVVVGEGEVEPGDRIRLLATDDPWTALERGDEGTVEDIAEIPPALSGASIEQIWIDWDTGAQLALLGGVDRYEVIDDDEDE